MVVAPVDEARLPGLRTLLASMNGGPGTARPDNPIVPFGAFKRLHYARFVILDDQTLHDFEEFGAPIPDFAVLLAFLGDCDGAAEDMLAEMTRVAGAGLRRIFSHCRGYSDTADLLAWMRDHSQAPAANYVNWIGRTVKQVREEARLREELVACVGSRQDEFSSDDPLQIRAKLVAHGRQLLKDGRLELSPEDPTPFGWRVSNCLHYAIVPGALLLPWLLAIPALDPLPSLFYWIVLAFLALAVVLFLVLIRHFPASLAFIVAAGVMLLPLFVFFPLAIVPVLVAAVVFLVILRHYERTEPEVIYRPEVSHILQLSAQEDYDVTNQFNALGSVKPSRFRRGLFVAILWVIDYFARHVYGRGHLGRIRTIHFARWVFLDGRKRMLFASSYDGSHESYMDDFINKVGWALNLAFTCGLGYPRTRWIIKDGADDELKFKYTQRRHQKPTESWYQAYTGLTVYDLERNARIRAGFERETMTDAEARAWLRDL
jgi:hypothetical protein